VSNNQSIEQKLILVWARHSLGVVVRHQSEFINFFGWSLGDGWRGEGSIEIVTCFGETQEIRRLLQVARLGGRFAGALLAGRRAGLTYPWVGLG
jgi:hypothetical protein